MDSIEYLRAMEEFLLLVRGDPYKMEDETADWLLAHDSPSATEDKLEDGQLHYASCSVMKDSLRYFYDSALLAWRSKNSFGGAKAEDPERTKRKYREGLPAVKEQNAKKECRTFNGGLSGSPQAELKEEPIEEEYLDKKKIWIAIMELKRLEKSLQIKEESVEELIEKKSLMEVIANLDERVNRRIKKDRVADLQKCMSIFYPPKLDISDVFHNRREWSDLQNSTKIKEYDEQAKQSAMDAANEVKQRLEEEKRETQTPWPKLSCGFLRYFIRTPATNGPSAYESEVSWRTPGSEQKYTVKDVIELQKKLFAKNKKTVKFSDFKGLEEALLETPRGEIPKYLQDIAKKVRKTCGVTETENVLQSSLLLLCAAVHEMDYVGLELLNWDRLLTWGATYNKAKGAGFQVKFVEEHLKKILYAYLGYEFKTEIDPTERVQKLEAELEVIEDCTSAKTFLEGTCLSHGLFPE